MTSGAVAMRLPASKNCTVPVGVPEVVEATRAFSCSGSVANAADGGVSVAVVAAGTIVSVPEFVGEESV